jgi:hypothetical protein
MRKVTRLEFSASNSFLGYGRQLFPLEAQILQRFVCPYFNNQNGLVGIFEIIVLSGLLLAIIGGSSSNNGRNPKYTADEWGHTVTSGDLIKTVKNNSMDAYLTIDSINSYEGLNKSDRVNELREKLTSNLENTKKIINKYEIFLEHALPPLSMQKLHDEIKSYRDFIVSVPSDNSLTILRERSSLVYRSIDDFENEVNKRESIQVQDRATKLYFIPLDIPGFPKPVIDMNGNFTISYGLPLGLGGVAFSNSPSPSFAKMLVVTYKGKHRYFALDDRPFTLFIPEAKHGISVSSEGNGDGILTITVHSAEEDNQISASERDKLINHNRQGTWL